MNMQVIQGPLIPFAGTSLGAALVFVMRGALNAMAQRVLTGFAVGVRLDLLATLCHVVLIQGRSCAAVQSRSF